MHDPFFRSPVVIETKTVGELHTLCSVSQAAIFLMEQWPEEHGPRYRDALQACTGRVETAALVDHARRSFLAAAQEAGMRVMDEDEDAGSAICEEEDDFLVRFLARETGITEAQARELINMIGTDRSSLLREARALKGQR